MKKILTITLLVLLIAGLFIACNAEAVKTMFGGECYFVVDETTGMAVLKDSQSKWWIFGGAKSGNVINITEVFEMNQSGDMLSCDIDDCYRICFSISSKELSTYMSGTPTPISSSKASTVTIVQPLDESINYNAPTTWSRDGSVAFSCKCNGTVYEFIAKYIN